MKLLQGISVKKKIIGGAVVIALATAGVAAALNKPQSTGADTSPLTTEVDRQGQELTNHEARISNTENDVKDLQDKTNTPPSVVKVPVPGASTTQTVTSTPNIAEPAPTPVPAPVTVVSSSINVGGQYDGYCFLTYSDNSHNYVKATIVTTTNGNSSSASNNCDDFIGQLK